MYLSPHFTLEELTASDTARREGLDNSPSPDALANLCRLSQCLEQLRHTLGRPIRVSSAYRSAEVNRRVGGAPGSAHTQGLAADIMVADMSARALAQHVIDSGLAFDQLILEFDRWVHLALAEGAGRQQVLTVRGGTGYLPGLQ
ncbi:peptidase M15 [Pseudomonas sp. MAFF212427]|uniref:Peptidase M15 n=1 Tax=Pseudomonas brassicae TaxID=2708063 RepID=A0A6B3NZ55_9PSED|nr:D-Ala-D-Ala carboxypeptidase family metallohydrolase [Pseudomonas brassicae]NER66451.1 peptidase M15 [Pseudomonas brassicae]